MPATLVKKVMMGFALSIAAIAMAPSAARADDYCREYTRTVYIGGMTQNAYGTACLQPDGSWMIVGEGLGNDIPETASNVDYVIHDNRQVIVPPRVVYYSRPQVNVYRSRPIQPTFVWYNNGHYKNGHYYRYNKSRYSDRDGHHDRRWRGGRDWD